MLAIERHNKILNLLNQFGTVRTVDLAYDFSVTDETIRRDLQILADEEKLMRIHGGASSTTGRPTLSSFEERSSINTPRKKSIAEMALNSVQPGKTYAFDSSTTALALVYMLPNLPFRVITNALAVIQGLVNNDNIEVISTGGKYHSKTNTFIGGDSFNILRRHHVDNAFISCLGLDLERGASEGFEQQAIYKELLIQISDKVTILVDSSKINSHSEYYFSTMKNITCIITDSGIQSSAVSQIVDLGIDLKVAAI